MAKLIRTQRAKAWRVSLLALGLAASAACSSSDQPGSSAQGGSGGTMGGAGGAAGASHSGASNGGSAGSSGAGTSTAGANDAGADNAGADNAGADNAGASSGTTTPVLLTGTPTAPALGALTYLAPTASDPSDIVDNLILTKLDVWLAPDATIGQVNSALAMLGGGIVYMRPGSIALTVGFPRLPDANAVEQARQALEGMPGILFAGLAQIQNSDNLPPAPANGPLNIGYLFATKFPQAWNLEALAVRDCESHPVPLWVADFFAATPPANFSQEVSGMSITATKPASSIHGYKVTAVAAAQFDANPATGANPFQNCLDIRGVRIDNFSALELNNVVATAIAGTKGIVNGSFGHTLPDCDASGCTPANFQGKGQWFDTWVLRAADWRAQTLSLDNTVLFAAAAGNDRSSAQGSRYEMFRNSRLQSEMTMAASGQLFGTSRLSIFQEASYFEPDAAYPTFPSLASAPAVVQALGIGIDQMLPPSVLPANNVVIAGSMNSLLQESTFSDEDPDVLTVSDGIRLVDGTTGSGTSYSAPQIAGLASFLWLLSSDLRAQPASLTRQAILENAVVPPSAPSLRVLDAFAAALSLDSVDSTPSAQNFPIRLALLDTNNDQKFNEDDVTLLGAAFDSASNPAQTWGLGDLNGDGYVGGTTTARFDLDRMGSQQYGIAQYADVRETYGNQTMLFDETAVTDRQVLCYYAYSPLYTGSISARDEAIAASCGLSPPDGGAPPADGGAPVDAGAPPGNCQPAGTFFCTPTSCCSPMICAYIDGYDFPQCYRPPGT